MPNGDPRSGFFYPTLKLMMNSYIPLNWENWFSPFYSCGQSLQSTDYKQFEQADRSKSDAYIENTRWVSIDIMFTRQGFENACWLREACRAI